MVTLISLTEITFNITYYYIFTQPLIYVYVLLTLPFFHFIKKFGSNKWIKPFTIILSSPFGLLLVIHFFELEVILAKPQIFELYAMTWHGFFLVGLHSFLDIGFDLLGIYFDP